MESKPASVLRALRAEIIAGTLPRGTRLKEDQLAERFGVSRVPVREALRQLETEGFVVAEKFKGVSVADSSPEAVVELMQIRRGLEVLAAQLAAGRRGGESADLLRAVVNEERSDQEVEVQSPRFTFHRLVAAASGNARLDQMIERLVHQTSWAFERVTQDEVASSGGDHAAVANAILRGSVVQAGLLMEEHLRRDEAIFAALEPAFRD
ncbi:DNA-binding GntR family transcriptional regulator [Frondihabitans sp. PhB188]|uniref:GntR family transcriptional regulator n=1 Tax=Frondihabitans sp. PhB188 TaxID=2485200 RepID=UPI000F4725DA|nr:GntR family transcriptional regulator [Frondihabitans sp. PhB188]ROQ36498.1 DNA-binding GntR family transcriptional regulator [Frondihabitans sp. PhB188]